MKRSLWSLPGPARFIEDIRSELGSGRSIVVLMPRHAPEDVLRIVKRAIGHLWEWTEIEPAHSKAPATWLCKLYGIDPGSSSANAVQNLIAGEPFAGRILSLGSIGMDHWSAWKQFLIDYASACCAVPQNKRSLFIALLEGFEPDAAPRDDVALCNLTWSDVIGEIDILLYASLGLRHIDLSAAKRSLLALSVARVALWDTEAADRLLEGRLEDMLAPRAILDELARDRGWDGDTPVAWEIGTENKIDGVNQVHSSICLISNTLRVLDYRIWSAQASVILPLIEQRRIELIPKLQRFLRLPIQVDGEAICDPSDLEIGHLAYEIDRSSADPRLKQKLRRLRRIRNYLAHMETLDLGLAWHDDVFAGA